MTFVSQCFSTLSIFNYDKPINKGDRRYDICVIADDRNVVVEVGTVFATRKEYLLNTFFDTPTHGAGRVCVA
jgi:hypothetical protein